MAVMSVVHPEDLLKSPPTKTRQISSVLYNSTHTNPSIIVRSQELEIIQSNSFITSRNGLNNLCPYKLVLL
jgi:hypothetical protein